MNKWYYEKGVTMETKFKKRIMNNFNITGFYY